MRGENPPQPCTDSGTAGGSSAQRRILPACASTSGAQRDLVRTVLAILFIGGLIATSFWILWPFLPATIWATTLVVATWPIMLQVQRRLWNRRPLAVAVMTLALLLVFVAPFWLAVATIAQNFDTLVGWGHAIVAFRLPAATRLARPAAAVRQSDRCCCGRRSRRAASTNSRPRPHLTRAGRPAGLSAPWAVSVSRSCNCF